MSTKIIKYFLGHKIRDFFGKFSTICASPTNENPSPITIKKRTAFAARFA